MKVFQKVSKFSENNFPKIWKLHFLPLTLHHQVTKNQRPMVKRRKKMESNNVFPSKVVYNSTVYNLLNFANDFAEYESEKGSILVFDDSKPKPKLFKLEDLELKTLMLSECSSLYFSHTAKVEEVEVLCHKIKSHEIWLTDCDCEKGQKARFRKDDFKGHTFVNCDFSGAEFWNCNFTGSKFLNCNFTGCEFITFSATNSVFKKCDFSESEITGFYCFKSDFSCSNFSGFSLKNSNATFSDFSQCTFSNFPNFKYKSTIFKNASFNNCYFKGAIMANMAFDNMDFKGCDFTMANLRNSNISNADFNAGCFSGANMESVISIGANFCQVNFYGCNICNANFSMSTFNFAKNIILFNKINGRTCYAVLFDDGFNVLCGCFYGSLGVFENVCFERYGNDVTNNYANQIAYLRSLSTIKKA